MRPGDWTKNVFVLPAFVFTLPAALAAGADAVPSIPDSAIRTALAFACFCAIASGFYCINDVLDAEDDRTHPVKRKRPIASGDVSPTTGTLTAVTLISVALATAFTVRPALGLVLIAYGMLQVGYNLGVKRVIFVDVVALALGFALRAVAGAVAIGVPISAWLLLCVFFLCLYLGFIKRQCDMSSAAAEGDGEWKSPAGYDDPGELNWLLGMSAVLSITTYLMYALSDHARAQFGAGSVGFALLSPLVMISVHRFYRRARLGRSDSPLGALREDRTVLVSVILFGAGTLTILYVPGVSELLESVFLVGAPIAGAATEAGAAGAS